ncbi:MAG: hypothetical protein KA020_06435 [Planctomycetes bacterium]|jgi:hypothetical protein|nr:hypothetical protein [Planctomycetota bacterium]MCC7066271.1 hypothetical protein [Planctomycetota bacterium]
MLALLLAACLPFAPQQPVTTSIAEAVVVRGDAELSPAEALVSAKRKAEEHVRDLWQDRAEQAFSGRRPFWLPDLLAREAMRRWLAELPIEQMATYVDREDRQREHEFGSSYQTTLWVAEEPRLVANSERLLRRATQQLERVTAVKFGGIVAGWAVLAVVIGWLDRLSRGYMTGRLRLLGLLGGVAFPALAFLL